MNPHERILRAAQSEVWAMLPDHLDAMFAFLELRAQGMHTDAETLATITAAAEVQAARAQAVSQASGGAVAVIPFFGMVLPRGNMMSALSGPSCCSAEMVNRQVAAAANDPNVRSIVLLVDSPGGSVAGIPELFSTILAARDKKTVYAVSEYVCASAAMWVAAAASEVWVSPSSRTGSIGVFMKHTDISGALEKAGVKVTLVSYGENKTSGNEFQPLEGDALAQIQAEVDFWGGEFDKAMAKGRGVTTAQVRAKFGQGKVFNAKDAVAIGMADKVGTYADLMAKLGVPVGGASFSAVAGASPRGAASLPIPVAATAADTPIAQDTAGCPRGDDCPAQADDIADSDDCPAADCPLRDSEDSESKAACQRAHAHRARLIQIATL